jgi:ParB-like chromosome segregation protein Spo0J
MANRAVMGKRPHSGYVVEIDAELAEYGETTSIDIDNLLPSDSPRLGGVDQEHVHNLAEAHDELPPIVVHRNTMRVIDGMHRVHVAALRGQRHVAARFFDGTDDEAFVLAVRLNLTHGLPLSAADRTTAAARILDTHPHWSDRAIALASGVSDKTVAAIRRRSTSESPQLNTRLGRDGRLRPTDATEGRRKASDFLSEKPDASLREIARAAGIAVATARDVRQRVRLGQDPILPRQRVSAPARPERRPVAEPVTAAENEQAGVVIEAPAVSLQSLWRDPSLRLTKAGRAVLRLLEMHLIRAEDWRRLSEQMPTHCTAAMAELAHECANSWQRFAQRLEQRGHQELS